MQRLDLRVTVDLEGVTNALETVSIELKRITFGLEMFANLERVKFEL